MKTTTISQTIIDEPIAMPNAHIALTERILPVTQRLLSLTYIK